MIVQFNPMINSSATGSAAFINFLRCVRAIATAAAGTSSITINPFTNNTGTIDNTRNCITSIIANTEAGGWTESSQSNVPQSGSFTAYNSLSAYTYLFDAYTASGKGTYPYLKFSVTSYANNGGADSLFGQQSTSNANSTFTTAAPVMFTFGFNTTTDWSSGTYAPGGSTGNFTVQSNTNYSQGPGTTSGTNKNSVTFFNNCEVGGNASYPTLSQAFNTQDVNRIFTMACTANYIIIWENNINNSYLNGYNNYLTQMPNGAGVASASAYPTYGNIFACGFRESQQWENSFSNNPTVYALKLTHNRSGIGNVSQGQTLQNALWAPLLTTNDSGVVSTTIGHYILANYQGVASNYELFGNPGMWNPVSTNTPNGAGTAYASANATNTNVSQGLDQPMMLREMYYPTNKTYSYPYKPVVDNTTGLSVPGAYPIIVRRSASGSWNQGGAIRGLYKSLSMPLATMKNYFASGQTFNIYNSTTGVTDIYLPIVFNEDMYLVRYA